MNMFKLLWLSCLALVSVLLLVSKVSADGTDTTTSAPTTLDPIIRARLVASPDAKATSVIVSYKSPPITRTITVDPLERPSLSQYKQGDTVLISVDNIDTPTKAISIAFAREDIPWTTATGAVLGSAFVLLVVLWLVMRASPLWLLRGLDNRFSKSKVQVGFWGLTVISVYLGTVALRSWYLGGDYIGGVEIPTNLLLLSGLSALSFGAAKAITSSKISAAVQEAPTDAAKKDALANTKPAKTGLLPLTQFFDDLVKDDNGNFDFGDTQMVLITTIAILLFTMESIYFLQSLALQVHTTLPDVDTTILSAFGLGQGAYLFKKAAGTPGNS